MILFLSIDAIYELQECVYLFLDFKLFAWYQIKFS